MEDVNNHCSTLREIEAIVVGLFKVVLNRPQLGLDDNLFELGMASLQATQLTSRINQTFDREVSRAAIYEHPTARTMAAWLTNSNDDRAKNPNNPQPRDGGHMAPDR